MVSLVMSEPINGESRRVQALLDSNLESVERAEEMVLGIARRLGFDEDDLHRIAMALRESVVNAVVHGNRYNANKKVHLSVDASRGELTIRVADEGDGFDVSALPDPLAEENLMRQSGRGILLMRAFVDEFEIRRGAECGTEIRMMKRLPRPLE
jgi:serine/threonine-protein kinase RsbW